MESFDPKTAKFTLLPINTGLIVSSSSIVHDHRIYIFGLSDFSIWDLRTYELIGRKKHAGRGVAVSQLNPVIYRNKGYFVFKDSRILEVNLESWKSCMLGRLIDQVEVASNT